MEHVTIISQEAITSVPTWIALVGGIIATLIVCSTFVYWRIVKDPIKAIKWMCWVGPIALAFTITWHIVTCFFCSVPTDRYRYEATIDKENMTIQEYEEFMKAYNHSYSRGGIYYFEDWPDDYK